MDYVLHNDDMFVEDKHKLGLYVLCLYDQMFYDKLKNLFVVYLFDYQLHLNDDDDDRVIMTKENYMILDILSFSFTESSCLNYL